MLSAMYYYVSGNTARGSVNYLRSNIEQINELFILTHPSDTLKTNVLNKIWNNYAQSYDIEIICSPLGKDFLEGVIIRELSLAIVTESIAVDKYPKANKIDLQGYLKTNEASDYDLLKKIDGIMDSAYVNFAKGLKTHDQLEQIYINEMDFNKADVLADDFIDTLLNNIPRQEQDSHIYRRLFGTNTKDGAVNVVPNLIRNISNCYYIKGRAGTGKSVFMSKVANVLEDYGYHIELYHCSFDPESIDMVRIPALDMCLFDSTDPHEFNPKKENIVIDLYEATVTPGTDERFADEITKVTKVYKNYMKKGLELIKTAGIYREQFEQPYKEKINEIQIENVMKQIYREVKK